MSRELLNKPIVLSLNNAWMAIGHRTVEQAVVAMNGGRNGLAPAMALDIGYERNADGLWNFDEMSYANPVYWDDWVKLPVRDFDLSLHSARLHVRVPTVIIAVNYSRMPEKKARFSRKAVFERDGGIDQYTGEYVPWSEGNLDHVIPRDIGGCTNFENIVWTKRTRNTLKANRLPHQVGLRLIRKPSEPRPMPVVATFKDIRHRDWHHFLRM